jgi:hypothetical protein
VIDVNIITAQIHDVSMRFPAIERAWEVIARLEDALHAARAHPDFEYCTTECGGKYCTTECGRKEAQGWEENITGGEPHSSWERFDYTEDHYWRRRKMTANDGEADGR